MATSRPEWREPRQGRARLAEPRHRNVLQEWKEQRVLQLDAEGLERSVIAERLAIAEKTVSRVLGRNGRPPGRSPHLGWLHGRGVPLPEDEVREILRRRREGQSIRRIAREVGCHTQTVLKYIWIARAIRR